MPLKTITDEEPQMNMTPMIDCVFLLLIFFMVGTQFSDMERDLQLEVPQVGDNPTLTQAPEKKVVNVFADGHVTLDQQPLTLNALTARLAQARQNHADIGVLIRADAGCPFQSVAEALNACKLARINELGISVKVTGATR
jgi:biopolymer transport protein ExbD